MNSGYKFTLSSFNFNLYSFSSPWPSILAFGSIFVYVLLVVSAISTTSWRSYVKQCSKSHYSLLFLYSTVCFLAALYELVMSGEGLEYAQWLFSSQTSTLSSPRFYCEPVPSWLRLISLSFIASKVWEWLDTLILIANGKTLNEIGFLHLYHHATTFFLFLFTTSFPVTEKAGMLLNGAVHALMYYHFAYRLPRFMRPILTGIQIVQLLTVTWFWIDCSNKCAGAKNYREQYQIEFAIPFALVPVYILLFVKFFVEQYCCFKREVKVNTD